MSFFKDKALPHCVSCSYETKFYTIFFKVYLKKVDQDIF